MKKILVLLLVIPFNFLFCQSTTLMEGEYRINLKNIPVDSGQVYSITFKALRYDYWLKWYPEQHPMESQHIADNEYDVVLSTINITDFSPV